MFVYLAGRSNTEPDKVLKSVVDIDIKGNDIRVWHDRIDGHVALTHFNPDCYGVAAISETHSGLLRTLLLNQRL